MFFNAFGDFWAPGGSLEADIGFVDTDLTRHVDPEHPETPNILKMCRKGHFETHFVEYV